MAISGHLLMNGRFRLCNISQGQKSETIFLSKWGGTGYMGFKVAQSYYNALTIYKK